MPIIDIRNVPQVVEFAPDNKVVEFTEDTVTAEVVVGPTVVEFSWGELVPGPGLRGGGVFEGTVHIDQDIPSLPNNSEPVDPNADYLMMWDASSNTHVKVLANMGGGGGSGLFAVENVGLGAEVHRNTVDGTAYLRSIVGEGGVSVVQEADEIVVSVDPSLLGSGPSVNTVSSMAIGCGTSITLTPSTQLTSLVDGDLMVMVVVANAGKYAGASFTYPAGWRAWRVARYSANVDNGFLQAVYWKFATSADLVSATHTFTNNDSGATICGYAFAFRGAHKQTPLMGLASDYGTGQGWYPNIGGVGSNQPIVDIITYTAGQEVDPPWTPGYSPDVGKPPDQYYYKGFNIGGTWAIRHFIGMREGSIFEDENLIAGETFDTSVSGSAWVPFQLARGIARPFRSTHLQATGGTSRHYIDYDILLTAGEKYTFALNQYQQSWNFSDGTECIGLGFVDPDGIERGYPFRNLNYPGSIAPLDPVSDLNSTWFVRDYEGRSAGVPSAGGARHVIMFTAQKTGTYKLRISHVVADSSSTYWTHGDVSSIKYVNSVLFRRGWWTPHMVPTPYGAVMGDSFIGRIHSWGWKDYTSFGASNRLAFSVCPAWERLPAATLIEGQGHSSGGGGFIDFDGLTLRKGIATGSGPHSVGPIYSVYPDLNGVRQSYYYEIKALSTGTPIFGYFANGAGASGAKAYWDFGTGYIYWPDGTQVIPTGGSGVAINDVFGCKIDFRDSANITWKFFRNGVEVATKTIVCSANGWLDSSEPWVAHISSDSNYSHTQIDLRVAFSAGDLAYQPTDGTLPYDPLGLPEAIEYTGIESTGTGISLVSGTGATAAIKSLVAGSNVAITDNGLTVTIDALTGAFRLPGVIAATLATPAISNWAPTGLSTASVVRCTLTGNSAIYKINEATDNKLLIVENLSSTYSITLIHDQDGGGGGVLSHRIFCPNSTTQVIPPYGSAILKYDAAFSGGGKWIVLAISGGGGASGNSSRSIYQQTALTASPVVLFSGDTAFDLVSNAMMSYSNGAVAGATGGLSASSEKAFSLPATNSGMSFPRPATFSGTDFWVELWFSSTTTLGAGTKFWSQAAGLIADNSGTSDWGLGFQGAMRPLFGIDDVDGVTPTSGSYNDGAWHHTVATRNGTTGVVELWIDGVSVASGTLPGGARLGFTTWWLGLNASGFIGKLANIAVYNGLPSTERIKLHYILGTLGMKWATLPSGLAVPASATAAGVAGAAAYDADYLYVCVAANTWKRSPLTTW